MKLLLLAVVAGACLFGAALVSAQTPTPAPQTPPWTPPKQFSAEQIITAGGGVHDAKTYRDGGKVRMEMDAAGMQVVSIIRADQGKMYSVMPAQKMVMVMPLNPATQQKMTEASGDDSKFELVGPDTLDGVPCVKYKSTASNGTVLFWWINPTDKTPVKMASADGSISAIYKNYKIGPQDAALFEPPADYKTMEMPSMPAPGGPPGQ